MSIVGIDFGSHTASIAIWYEEKNGIEVIADDLGSRTIPSTVAYRGDEIITGQSAISQMHKNASNTFDDVRSMLLNPDIVNVNVPLLDKEITVQELCSHFFRNIHNQIKQQVGKAVRDCVISVPSTLDENMRKRLVESAQAGGMRIKCCLNDSVSSLVAYQLDDPNLAPAKTLVVDIGWSKTDISLYNVSGGLFFPVSSVTLPDVSGSVFVKLLAAHCAKDFARKAKFPCDDNKRSMMRLSRECENAMKSLSTGAEATIDIDSLCEGVDFSMKLSRARFEDLLTIPFIQLKKSINALLESAVWAPESIQVVCMSGGGCAIPKVIHLVKGMFPTAHYPVGRFESSETQCVGAAMHGKYLFEQGLLDNAPTTSPLAQCLSRPLLLSPSSTDSSLHAVEVLPVNTVLPVQIKLAASATVGQQNGCLQVLAGSIVSGGVDAATPLGEVVFTLDGAAVDAADAAVSILLSVSVEGEISIEVTQTVTKLIVGNLTIPAGTI